MRLSLSQKCVKNSQEICTNFDNRYTAAESGAVAVRRLSDLVPHVVA